MDLPTKTDDIRMSIPQILDTVSKEKFHDRKVELLQLHNHLGLQIFLKAWIHPNITFKLPRGSIPVRNPDQHTGDIPVGLYKLEKAYQWISGTPDCERVNNIERERSFMEFADTMDRTELPALIALKDKDRTGRPGVCDQCVVDAFPDMFTEDEKALLDPSIPKPKPGPNKTKNN